MPEFQQYRKGKTYYGEPALSIHVDRSAGYITQAALDEFFKHGSGYYTKATIYTDAETSTLAINVGEEGQNAYTVSVKDDGGASISIGGAVRNAFGADPSDLEATFSTPLEKDDETGYLLADLSGLVERLTDEIHCPDCGKRCKTEAGLKTHRNSKHLGETDDESDGKQGGSRSGDAAPEHETPTPIEESADVEALDLSGYGQSGQIVTAEMVIDALDGAQSVYHVKRALRLSDREIEDILRKVGLLERLRDGTGKLERAIAERHVREAIEA